MGEIMENLTLTAALAKALGGGGGGGGGGVNDVLLNGQSIVNAQGKAEIPLGGDDKLGAVKGSNNRGVNVYSDGTLAIVGATNTLVKNGYATERAIVPAYQHMAAFFGLAKVAGADMKDMQSYTVGIYPEAQKSAISQMLSAPETVSGSTPSITAKAGVQYICGEVSTIDITVPETGIIDVIFESGSTPAVLTVTPPTGMTMKWAGGFDPTSLEADTVYEINITIAGSYCLGTATSWA